MKEAELKVGQVLKLEPDNGWRGVVIASNPGDGVPRYASISIRAAGGCQVSHEFGRIREDVILDATYFKVDRNWLA